MGLNAVPIGGLLAVLLVGCGWFSPAGNTAAAVQPAFLAAEANPQSYDGPVLVENRQIVLEWPEVIREKDSDWIVLSLVMDPVSRLQSSSESQGSFIDAYETHNVVAVARFDTTGLDSWRDEVREPMRPGKPVTFRWRVHAAESGVYQGVVWLYLDFVPKGDGEVQRVILLSRPIEIESISLLGMPGWMARGAGGIGLLLSALLGYPFLHPFLERILMHKKERVKYKS